MVSIAAWVSFWSILIFYTLNRYGLFRVPKEIEIIGLDISELGGVNEDVYSKLRKDFSLLTPTQSPKYSQVMRRTFEDLPKQQEERKGSGDYQNDLIVTAPGFRVDRI
jgi:hypothetical protein